MPPYRASHIRPGRRLSELDLNQLVDDSQREIQPVPGGGVQSSLIGSMQHLELLPETLDPASIKQAFIGQITPLGPDDEEDHEGSMYWVQEMTLVTPEDSQPFERWTFEPLHEVWKETYGPDYAEEMGLNLPRWVTAINLAEYNLEDEASESHALAFGAAPLVRCRMLVSPDTIGRWYFDRAAGGTQLGVVRSIPSDDSETVGVQAVQTNPKTGDLEFVGDVVELRVWPNMVAEDYKRFLWPIKKDTIFRETAILKVTFVDNEWKLEQTMRFSFPPPPPESEEIPITDCDVVRPV